MNTQTRAAAQIVLVHKVINRFSELEVALRSILKADIVPKEQRAVITSFAAYLHVKHFEGETRLIDILETYVETVQNRTSTWFDITNIKTIDAVNEFVTSLVFEHHHRENAA